MSDDAKPTLPPSLSPFDPAQRAYDYARVDVFAERPFEGNQLAVFPDARGLSEPQMQMLAREMNLSETTFVFPRAPEIERERGVLTRVFTVREELPFAGHPTLGTASWLSLARAVPASQDEIALELLAGRIPVRLHRDAGPGVYGAMRQLDPVFAAIHPPAEVAPALGLAVDDLDPALPVQTVSTGSAFCIVPLRSLAVLGRLAIPQAAAQAYLAGREARFFYCIAPEQPGAGADFRARMQFYNGEDPATGSAAGCAAAYLVRHGRARSGEPVVLSQGSEVHRPSRLVVQATRAGEDVRDVVVGGRTIPIASGRLFLP